MPAILVLPLDHVLLSAHTVLTVSETMLLPDWRNKTTPK